MKRVLLTVAYDGTDYRGWQVQPGGHTIEDELNIALSELLQEEIRVSGASRTDSGVHANCNLAVFDTSAKMPPEKISYALNQRLPSDIRVRDSREVEADFHPRYVKTIKTYEYHIWNDRFANPLKDRYTYFTYYKLDIEAMRTAAACLKGEHDFAAFCSANAQVESTVREITDIEVVEYDSVSGFNYGSTGREIVIRVSGYGFLYNMVRIIAGTLIEAGRGAMTVADVKNALDSADRSKAGPTAPAKGLLLYDYRIVGDDMNFDKNIARDAFYKYTDSYDSSDEKIKLKIIHTMKVAEICVEIAESLKLNQKDAMIAYLSGVLHDVGRFEQVKQYGTFDDAVSVNHAKLSADLLFVEKLIYNFVPEWDEWEAEDREILEAAIRLHNEYRIPEGYSDRVLMFANLLRDADKVDIMRVHVDSPLEEIYSVSKEEFLNSMVSDEVLKAFNERHCVLKSLKKTAIDILVGHASLCFELVYKRSRELAAQQGYIWQMLSYETDNEATRKLLAHMKKMMEEFLLES